MDPELYWATRFWVPLDQEGYKLLAFVASLDTSLRRREWAAKWRKRSVTNSVLGFDVKLWRLATAGMVRPVFIPTVQCGFESHQMLHRTLTPEAWMRLRTIGPQSFAECGLAYVELGAIISRYYRYPYGVLDESVHTAVRDMMPSKNMIQPKMRRRHWIVGCLLQHAGADTTRLARFCVKELEYNPRSCTKYPLLQCLAPQVRVSSSKKDTLERLSILEAILAKLPVVSAKEYAQLTQDQLNDDMRQTATAGALTLEPLIQDEWGAALTECETDFTGGTGPECETDFTGGMGPELFNETVSSRQIQQEHPPHLAKRKGIEGGSGSSLDGAGQSVLGAWGQSVVDAPTVEVPMVEGGDLLMAGGVSHSACVVRCDKTAGQPSKAPTIQQLERLVNQDQGTVVDDRFMDTFAEAVWKEYGPLLVPPMDHLMAELDHYLCAQ